MSAVWFLCFLFALPPLAALGHDVYLAYITGRMFRLSDLGVVLQSYVPDFFVWLREAMTETYWVAFGNPVMALPTLLVASIPAILLYVPIIGLWVVRVGPFRRDPSAKALSSGKLKKTPKSSESDSISSRDRPQKKFKYGRR